MARNRSRDIRFPRNPLFGKKIWRWVFVGKKASAALSAGYIRVKGLGTVQYKGSRYFSERTQNIGSGITWIGRFDSSIKSFDGYKWEAIIYKFSSGSPYVLSISKLRSEGEISDGSIEFFSQPVSKPESFKNKNDAKYHAILWLSMNAYPDQLFKLDGLVTNKSEQYRKLTIKERFIVSAKFIGYSLSKIIWLFWWLVCLLTKIGMTIAWLPYAAIMFLVGLRSRTWRPGWMPKQVSKNIKTQEKETIKVNGHFYERKT